MFHFFGAITNKKGDALPGYYVRLTDANGNGVSLYSDGNGTPIINASGIADAAKVDDNGNASFYVQPGEYNLNVYAADASTLYQTIPSIPIGLNTITLASGSAASTRSQMADIELPVAGQSALLTESGREGMFVFDSADHSTLVAADAQQGIYVAPSSDTTGASGAWVRDFNGPVNPEWFGIVRGTSGVAATNSAILHQIITCLQSRVANLDDSRYPICETIRFPADDVYDFTGDEDFLVPVSIEGATSAYAAGGTKLNFTAGHSGFRFQYVGTNGETGSTGSGTTTSSFSRLRNLRLFGGYSGTEGEHHGVVIRAPVTLEDVWISTFEGDGFFVYADTATNTGNANGFQIIRGGASACRNGLRVQGNDTNAGLIQSCNFNANRAWGVWDSGFLGNTYVACEAAGNGWDGAASSVPTACTLGGFRYYVRPGQATAASTNSPTGTATDNTYWGYFEPGGSFSGVVPWVSGTTFREGGSYKTDNSNARHVFNGCYIESDQNPGQIAPPSIINGGTLSGGGNYGSAISLNTDTSGNAILGPSAGPTRDYSLTLNSTNTTATIQAECTSANTVPLANYGQVLFFGSGMRFDTQRASTAHIFNINGSMSAQFLSTGLWMPAGMSISMNGGTTVLSGTGVLQAAAFPALTGDVTTSAASLATTVNGAPTATTGLLTTSSTGVGYRTGAGGAVTQTTSRTTGVTVNKPCGSITLVSAAGSATYSTFTVTNSTVAATDTVEVVQKSGSNLYNCLVTAVAAGSFNVSVSAVSGTATEAPVLNFTVTKGVTA